MAVQKPPIEVVHLFPVLEGELVSLLKSLSPEDWQKPTLAKRWQVKDIVAHLLDTSMRALSVAENHFADPPGAINSYRDLVDYLNQLNADWVKAMRRVSPSLLVLMLEQLTKPFSELMANTPLFEPAVSPVSWAGEETSLNWFHIAREYTERWHHQMQIRDAVGKPGKLIDREMYYPCMATFMYGLPYALRHMKPMEGTAVKLTISNLEGADWVVLFEGGNWKLCDSYDGTDFTAKLEIMPDAAWKLFTKGISPGQAKAHIITYGDEEICDAVLGMVAVMA